MTRSLSPLVISDPVRDDVPGAREIGFTIPDIYNASDILFDNLARGNGSRVALRGSFGTVTYLELCRSASRFGNLMLGLQLGHGDRIALFLDDTPAYPAAIFGAIRAGLVPVLINTQTPADLLRFYLNDSGARILVFEDELSSIAVEAARGMNGLHLFVNGQNHVGAEGAIALQDTMASQSDFMQAVSTHRDDMAFWMYSSGSTGQPKGIVHLQHDLAYSIAAVVPNVFALEADDICFSIPKIFFAYGFSNSLAYPFSVGASSVLMQGRPESDKIFSSISAYSPTILFGLPTLYTALAGAANIATVDFSSLRMCYSAAETLSPEIAAQWKRASGKDIVEGLGSTEMVHAYLSNLPGGSKSRSAGRRVPGYEIRLVNPNGEDVSQGEEGVMMVRGGSSSPCYWNRPDKTDETMRHDWIYTGDRFICDDDGYYYFCGRADDLVKVSGQWVYPLEIELCLARHPGVREVAVIPTKLPDERTTIEAFVVPVDAGFNEASLSLELKQFAKQNLLPFKYPRAITFLSVIPKTGTGKKDRQALLKLRALT